MIRFWKRFGLRSTGEKAGLVVSRQIPAASCSTSRKRNFPMSLAINVVQANTAGELSTDGTDRSALCCHAPVQGSRTTGHQPPRGLTAVAPAGTARVRDRVSSSPNSFTRYSSFLPRELVAVTLMVSPVGDGQAVAVRYFTEFTPIRFQLMNRSARRPTLFVCHKLT